MAESRTAATSCKEAVFTSRAVVVTRAFTLAETGAFLTNIHSRCGCLTGISIGPPIAATYGAEFAGADLRSRLADTRCVAPVLGKAVIGIVAVSVCIAWLFHDAGSLADHVNSCRGSNAWVAVGVAITPTDRIEFKRAEHRFFLAGPRGVTALLRETVIGITAVSVGVAFALNRAGSLTDDIHSRCGCLTGISIGPSIAATYRAEFAGAELRLGLTGSRGVTAFLGEAVIGIVAVGVGIALVDDLTETLAGDVDPCAGGKACISVGFPVTPTDRMSFKGTDFRSCPAGSRRVASFLGKTVIGLIAVSVGIALFFCNAGSLADHVDSSRGRQAWVPVGPTVTATDRVEFAGAKLGFFLAGSRYIATLFGEAVVSIAAVGIAVAPAICQTGSFSDHIDSCGCGGAGIAVSVSIAPADRLELKGAEHGSLPACSWGVAAFLRETVFSITTVGIAGTLGLLAGSKIFHARVGFSSCAGIGVGLPIASTDGIKNFVTPTTGARVHAGFKDGVDLRGVTLAGGDCDRGTLLQAFGIRGPIDLESCTCEASEARFIFRVGGHPGLKTVHWIRVNRFCLREGNGLGIRKMEVVRELEYAADCRVVVPHLKGVDHVAISAAMDQSRGVVPLFGIQSAPIFQRVTAGIAIWVGRWVCK